MDDFFEIGPIRPPSEAQSLLIRVTRNCPWNKCEFCHTYKGEVFSFRAVDEIKKDIDRIKNIVDEIRGLSWSLGYAGEVNRDVLHAIFRRRGSYHHAYQSVVNWLYFGGAQVFLQDANSLMVKTSDLVAILKYLKEKLPSIQRITSYARAKTVAKKTVAELKELHAAGLSRIHIGLETGYDPLLAYMKKGVTAEEHVRAGRNVVESGISLSEYVMPGLGGIKWWREHALATAHVLNQINPDFIRLRTLYVRADMPIHKKVESGEFVLLTDDQVVKEIKLFLENLQGIESTVVSDHILNLLEEVQGQLPGDQEKMINIIDQYLSLAEEERLAFRLGRRLGYYRLLADLQDQNLRARLAPMIKEIQKAADPQAAEKEVYRLMENYI
ncbi:MAG: radical SAM protein [Thermodesulfobacteriota bacterium]